MGLVEAFRAFDADNDGSITAAELGGIMGSLGYNPSQQDVKAMMMQGDSNKDGLLSIEEFLELNTKDLGLGDLKNSLRTAFEGFDAGCNEVVTAEELYEVTESLGIRLPLEDCQNIIASMDMDGDGVVGVEDFKLIINSLL